MSSPLVAGDSFIANRWLYGSANVMWIGDSLSADMEQYFFQTLRVTPAGWLLRGSTLSSPGGSSWSTVGTGALGAVGLLAESIYSPFPTKEAVFNGTAVPSTGLPGPIDARIISQSGDALLIGTRPAQVFGGGDWLVGRAGIRLRSVIYRNANFANGIVRNYVRNNSIVYKGTGNYLTLSSSAPSYYVDDVAVVPPAAGEDLAVEAQSFAGATPTNGSNYALCCALVTTGAPGFTFIPASNVGWDVGKWLDTGVMSDAALAGVLPPLGITDFVIALGNYNSTSQTAAQFQASLLAVVARLRAAVPTASITFLPTYDTNNPSSNNAAHLSAFADAHFAAQQQTANSCFLNLYRAAGPWSRISSNGFTSDGVRPSAAGAACFLQAIQSLIEQLMAGVGSPAAGRYAAQADIEDLFGVTNVATWSTQDSAAQLASSPRVQRALDFADAAINDFFRGGPYVVPLTSGASAATIRRWAAVIAGNWLFRSRISTTASAASASLTLPAGASFSAAVNTSNDPYQPQITDVYAEMAACKAGVVGLDCVALRTSAPSISMT